MQCANIIGQKNWCKRQRASALECRSLIGCFSKTGYLISLGAFGPLDDIELDLVTFFEALISFALNGAVMNEDIGAAITSEESVPFCVVEPFNRSLVLCQV